MSFAEKQFRDEVAEVLEDDTGTDDQLFEIMELFRDAQYDLLSGISVSNPEG